MIEHLEGRAFADRPFRVCAEKVAEFVEATGDDPRRWTSSAPPGFAAALLFVVAPELLADPAVTGAVVHGDQTFKWTAPITVETDLRVTGTVERVRTRGEVAFVAFSLTARDARSTLVEGRSTFLIAPSLAPVAEEPEVAADERGDTGSSSDDLPASRSASRADLVRYAAATRDWNPIHWDRQSAIDAGLGGIVVHGLLQASWLTQVAALAGRGDAPLSSARFRFTAPLRPGEVARIEGDAASSEPELRLVSGEAVTVTGRFQVEP